ncbi:MAG: hypothetical protein O7D86_04585 [Proteobacteria bacterium]|nr:hypothetical protein [Pseudomonadota bacterium]
MYDFADYELGKFTDEALKIETRQENADAALELVKQCNIKLAIISKDLEPTTYDQLDFVEALKKLALKGRHVEIRILIFEPGLVVRRGHKLLDLAGKISSFIELRTPSSKYKSFNESVLIADEIGYLFRENADRYKGKVNFNSRRESKYLLDVFNDMWETAEPDPNLRRMHI